MFETSSDEGGKGMVSHDSEDDSEQLGKKRSAADARVGPGSQDAGENKNSVGSNSLDAGESIVEDNRASEFKLEELLRSGSGTTSEADRTGEREDPD